MKIATSFNNTDQLWCLYVKEDMADYTTELTFEDFDDMLLCMNQLLIEEGFERGCEEFYLEF